MATRANIIVRHNGQEVATFYKHYDGYPEGLGEQLKDAFKDCKGSRDTLRCISKIDEVELTEGTHGDIEYLYHINADFMSHAGDTAETYIQYQSV